MRKMIAGLAAGVMLALGGMANADCVNCDEYDLNVNVNGNPFFGKWAIVDDRPYLGVEALSDSLKLPRKHYYKAWDIARDAKETGDPLMLMTTAEGTKIPTLRFGGVTMVDLYAVANALDLPVHHNFRNKTFQVGSDYNGEMMKGAWYRYMARKHGWALHDDLDRYRWRYHQPTHLREWDDLPWEPLKI
jgi:hypothetical protein